MNFRAAVLLTNNTKCRDQSLFLLRIHGRYILFESETGGAWFTVVRRRKLLYLKKETTCFGFFFMPASANSIYFLDPHLRLTMQVHWLTVEIVHNIVTIKDLMKFTEFPVKKISRRL